MECQGCGKMEIKIEDSEDTVMYERRDESENEFVAMEQCLSRVTVHEFSAEILFYIFQHMDMNTRLNAGFTCRKWRQVLVSTRSLWKVVSLQWDEIVSSPTLQDKLSIYQRHSCDTVTDISIAYNVEVSPHSCIDEVFRSTHPQLQRFSFSYGPSRFPYNNQVLLDSFVIRHWNLNNLTLYHASPILLDLQDILLIFPKLSRLVITGSVESTSGPPQPAINNRPASDEIIQHPIELLHLIKFYTPAFDNFLLENLQNLQLRGSSTSFLTNYRPRKFFDQQSTMLKFPKLHTLKLVYSDNILPNQFDTRIEIHAPLKYLNLMECNVSAICFSQSSLNKLHILKLIHCVNVRGFLQKLGDSTRSISVFRWTSDDVEQRCKIWELISKWPNLHILELRRSYITDEFIDRLADISPNLRSLDVSYCKNISAAALARLVKRTLSSNGKSRIENLQMAGVSDANDTDFLRKSVNTVGIK